MKSENQKSKVKIVKTQDSSSRKPQESHKKQVQLTLRYNS